MSRAADRTASAAAPPREDRERTPRAGAGGRAPRLRDSAGSTNMTVMSAAARERVPWREVLRGNVLAVGRRAGLLVGARTVGQKG